VRQERAEPRGDGDLHDGAGHGDAPYGEQIGDGEVQPDAEHEEDDADLGELRRQPGVGDVAGGERAHGDARQQVADERGQMESRRDQAEQKRQAEPGGDRRDEGGLVRHRRGR
jgi:hypothetical protein